jgi:hypothetical protein
MQTRYFLKKFDNYNKDPAEGPEEVLWQPWVIDLFVYYGGTWGSLTETMKDDT